MLVIVNDGQGGFVPWTQGIELDEPGKGGDASSLSSRTIDDRSTGTATASST